MSTTVIEIEENSFDAEVLQTNIPVLVDFWAPWCGPCKAIGPIVDELAKTFDKKIKFVKLNVDKNPEIAAKYGIKAIPTLIFFKNGKQVNKITGMIAKAKLESTIDKLLP